MNQNLNIIYTVYLVKTLHLKALNIFQSHLALIFLEYNLI
jgi:hypothetical protein